MPDMGWSDGIVNVTIRFDDSNGKVIGAAAGSTNPRLETLPAPPFSLPDASGRERVTPFYEVMRVEADGGARTISVYGTKDGSWCWTHSNANGSGGGSCGLDGPTAKHPHVFSLSGTGTGAVQSERVASMRYGATSGEAARVSLTYASGEAVEAETIPFPSELGRPWRAFAVIEPEGHSVLREVVAFDAAGSELERFELPQAISVPPYVVEPLAAIAFSGADAATGGDFELPPPAFPVNIRLAVEYEGDVTATVVCDTGKTPIVEAGERAAFVEEEAPGTFLLLMPPEARKCRFEVSGRGAWSFRSH
jgi:hypothetical protein